MAEASLRPTASSRWRCRATRANARGRLFMRILSYSTQKGRIFLVISTLASICAGATLPLMNILFARLVKTFNSQVSTSSHVTSASFMSVINEYVVYIVYLFIGRLILAYIAIFGFRLTSLSISASIRSDYLRCLFRQPISTLDALPSGQTAAIITITANILQLGISERLSSLIQAMAVIVVALTIGCIYSLELTLVTACGLLLIVCWYSVLTPIIVKKQTTVQQAERDAMNLVGDALLGVRMIAACGADGKMTARYTNLIERVESVSQNLSPLLAVQHAPVFFTMFATFALCFWYAVRLYMDLKFATVESLVVVLLSVMTMIAHLNAISVPLTAVSNAVDAAAIFFTIIDAPKPTTTGLRSSAIALDKDLDLRGINFAYPSRHDVRVLQGFDLTIPAGKTTAIVGPSGSGKSTVVALISRWYELGGGDAVSHYLRNGLIKIGTHDLSSIDLHWWRAQIGLVQQDPFLFNDTIHRNVEHGLVGTVHEHASSEVKVRLVQQACKDAFADDFIQKLPEGYDTPVGEVGLKLSGGQRQRIAIARAIVRNPTILIFDEATSALDATSERIVQAALANASQGRTTIVIAHRLSTIRNADQIAVVAKGRVVQVGNHDALLTDRDGAYWRLVNAQHLAASMTKSALEDFWDERSNRGDGVLAEKESYDTLVEHSSHVLQDDDDKNISAEKISDTTGCEPGSTKIGVTSHCPIEGRKKGILGGFSMLLIEQKQNWLKYFVILAAAAGAGSTSSIQAYLFARLITGFTYWGQQLISSTSFLCVMLVVLAVGVGVSYFTLGWVANNASAHTVSFYRKEYFRNIITKHISFFDDPDHSSGLLSARIATDPTQLQQLLGINMAMVIISLFNITGCITIAIVFHWKLGLVVIASSLPIILACGWYRVRHEVRFEARNNKVFAESARYATEAIRGIRTVASLTLEQTVCHHYNSMLQAHVHRSWKEARFSCAAFALSDSMVLLCKAFSLWYGGSLLAAGTLQSFDFLVVYLAIIQGSLAAGQWLSFGPNIAQVSAAASRIHAMRTDDTKTEAQIVAKHEESHRWTLPASLLWKGADIEFRDIHFRYPTRNVPVLRGCSLTILHGQFAAIVGSSGAGKTSVISLLERFYDPEAGTIFFNGEDIALTPASTLRNRMSLVAQEASIFHGTIRDNILFGVDDDDRISETQLVTASRDAGIHDFVCSLPEGYNTDVGQSGVSLSGGQRQRIAIARALIRDPAVLLLDEATSSLDSETEREVQAVFERTGKGRTMVVVAHRLATVQHADVIFVMHEGRVVEKGDHASLLAAKGRYWHMCEAQALNA